jgi:hypothetical protein
MISSRVTFDYGLFMEEIKVYKDLKFMLLRLIHDYYEFKV